MPHKQKILSSPLLKRFPEIVHGFTTKELGIDYNKIAQQLKLSPEQIYYLPDQQHSNQVVCVDKNSLCHQLSEGDALVTDRSEIVLGVRTADCVPVLCYDPIKKVVAAIHAGYKGTLRGIVQNTFETMQRLYACCPQDFFVAVGPAVCMLHYEVSPEIMVAFKQKYGKRFMCKEVAGERPHLDVRGTVQMILKDLGVLSSNIDTLDLCTFERDDLFYSYRREGEVGRQFNFIGMSL